MTQVDTSYTPNSVTTRTDLAAPAPAGVPGGLQELLDAVIRKKLAAANAPAPVATHAPSAGPAPMAQPQYKPLPSNMQPGGGWSGGGAKSQLQMAQERDQILQMQARQNPAPMRMVTGPGIIPGYVMDTNAMNAYQRAAYLPNNAAAAYGPEDSARAQGEYDDERAWSGNMAAGRARSVQNLLGTTGGAAPGTPGGSVGVPTTNYYGRY